MRDEEGTERPNFSEEDDAGEEITFRCTDADLEFEGDFAVPEHKGLVLKVVYAICVVVSFWVACAFIKQYLDWNF